MSEGKRVLLPLMVVLGLSAVVLCQTTALTPQQQNGRWGYVNDSGVFVIPPKYLAAKPFADGLALVVTSKPWTPLGSEYGEFRLAKVTWIDTSGREIRRPISVRSARQFSDGLAAVTPDTSIGLRNGCAKSGYIDKTGRWAVPPKFDIVTDFSEGLAAVNVGANCGMGGKWGYIDKDGSFALPPKFLFALPFKSGRACVAEERGNTVVIDYSGRVLAGQSCK